MFGKRLSATPPPARPVASVPVPTPAVLAIAAPRSDAIESMGFAAGRSFARSDKYFEVKRATFAGLIANIDLAELAKLKTEDARKELRDLASEIVNLGPALPLTEREELLEEICNDVLGLGPLEPLLAQDDITDIMINGARECYIEVDGQLIPQPCSSPTTASSPISASGSPAGSGGAWTIRRRSAMRDFPTAAGSISSFRRWRSTARR